MNSVEELDTVVICCDPGTGVTSPMGLAAFTPDTNTILYVDEFWTQHSKVEHRIRDISIRFEESFAFRIKAKTVLFFIESFVMRGKGGETLQRMIGSLMGRVPYEVEIGHVSNTAMKLIVGGHGASDKRQVAEGVIKYFGPTKAIPKQLLQDERWDVTDALGIGIAGYLTYLGAAKSHADKAEPKRPRKTNGTKQRRAKKKTG
jgi:Holliday junction resolvasome RuvABC endonuclease subunit